MSACGELAPLLGVHVLGMAEPEDAAAVEAHLRTCPDCRALHDRLAALTPLLDLVDPAAPVDPAPPPRLEGAVLAGFASERPSPPRRRDRWRASRWPAGALGAIAGAAATVAVLALAGVFSSEPPSELRVVLRSPTLAGATAEARLVPAAAGTEIELRAKLPRLHGDQVYELWFAGDGGVVSAGTFRVGPDGSARVRLTTAARAGRYHRLGITREPDARDPARNGQSVAAAPLPHAAGAS